MKFRGCFKEGLRVFQDSFKVFSRKIEGHLNVVFKSISRIFRRGFKTRQVSFHGVKKMFQRSFKKV